MRLSLRPLLALGSASLPFLVAAACSSSSPSSEDLSRPTAGASGQGGAGVSGSSGQSGAAGSAGAGLAGQAGGTAGAGGSGQAGASGEAGSSGGGEAGAAGGPGGAGPGGAGTGGAGAAGEGPGGAGGEPGGVGGVAGEGGVAGVSGSSGQAGEAGASGSGGGENTAELCQDGIDNDGDKFVDCNDFNCCKVVDCKKLAPGSTCAKQGWPTCDEQPAGAEKTTIPALWAANPADYKPVWLEALTVTAISFGACSASGNFQCLVFLQTQPGYGSLAEGKHQGIKLSVSPKASFYFSTLNVGDVINLYGHAIRFKESGHNELRVHVDLERQGCMKKVGAAVPTPIGGVALADLTIDNYENAIGPLLVQVDTVKGRPTANTSETFALFESDSNTFDAGLELTQVLTPYYLPGGNFQGLTADKWTNFSSIGGVYSVFVVNSNGESLKYRMLGPRTQGEIVQQP